MINSRWSDIQLAALYADIGKAATRARLAVMVMETSRRPDWFGVGAAHCIRLLLADHHDRAKIGTDVLNITYSMKGIDSEAKVRYPWRVKMD